MAEEGGGSDTGPYLVVASIALALLVSGAVSALGSSTPAGDAFGDGPSLETDSAGGLGRVGEIATSRRTTDGGTGEVDARVEGGTGETSIGIGGNGTRNTSTDATEATDGETGEEGTEQGEGQATRGEESLEAESGNRTSDTETGDDTTEGTDGTSSGDGSGSGQDDTATEGTGTGGKTGTTGDETGTGTEPGSGTGMSGGEGTGTGDTSANTTEGTSDEGTTQNGTASSGSRDGTTAGGATSGDEGASEGGGLPTPPMEGILAAVGAALLLAAAYLYRRGSLPSPERVVEAITGIAFGVARAVDSAVEAALDADSYLRALREAVAAALSAALTTSDGDGSESIEAPTRRSATADAGVDDSSSELVHEAWDIVLGSSAYSRPETKTPGQVSRRAVANGLPRGPVEEITDAFRDVEYGGADPGSTSGDVRDAVTELRDSLTSTEGTDADTDTDTDTDARGVGE